MNSYSQLLRLTWRVIIGSCCLLLVACIRDDELAGIDGSGKTPIPDPGNEVAVSVKQPLVAQGAINGFGSVIIHGKHFDTSKADFYRHGQLVTEAAFEVGDMVAVSGYTNEQGEMFAEKVFFPINFPLVCFGRVIKWQSCYAKHLSGAFCITSGNNRGVHIEEFTIVEIFMNSKSHCMCDPENSAESIGTHSQVRFFSQKFQAVIFGLNGVNRWISVSIHF